VADAPPSPLLPTRADVLGIHRDQIRLFGGASIAMCDQGLLDSALAAPENLVYYMPEADLFEVAASYCYHLVKNHPFVDGNKRAGLHTAIFFLGLNYLTVPDPKNELKAATLAVADGSLDKPGFAVVLRRLAVEIAPPEGDD
jgi:death on curing protein